ncbi:MAG: Trm112 family protein [Acidimicrobiia bacterium]|nr:Trm112 family protein [Acidimicrobiia bacterium]
MALIDPRLAGILVCPACHGSLEELEESSELRCTQCGLAYPVTEGVPNMLVDEARPTT